MPKARPSAEFQRFDRMMGDLLSVPKSVIDARVAQHKAQAAQNPRKRGPKPKVRTGDAPASLPGATDEAAS